MVQGRECVLSLVLCLAIGLSTQSPITENKHLGLFDQPADVIVQSLLRDKEIQHLKSVALKSGIDAFAHTGTASHQNTFGHARNDASADILESEADVLTSVPAADKERALERMDNDVELFESHAEDVITSEKPKPVQQIDFETMTKLTKAFLAPVTAEMDLEAQSQGRFDLTPYEYHVGEQLFHLMAHQSGLDRDPMINEARLSTSTLSTDELDRDIRWLDINFFPSIEEVGRSLARFSDISRSPVITAQAFINRVGDILGKPATSSTTSSSCEVATSALTASATTIMTMNSDPWNNPPADAKDTPISACDYVRFDLLSRGVLSEKELDFNLREAEKMVDMRMSSAECCRDAQTTTESTCDGVKTEALYKFAAERTGAPAEDDKRVRSFVSAFLPAEFGGISHTAGSCLSPCEYTLMRSLFEGHVEFQGSRRVTKKGVFSTKGLFCAFATPPKETVDDAEIQQHTTDVKSDELPFNAFLKMIKALSIAKENLDWTGSPAVLSVPSLDNGRNADGTTAKDFIRALFQTIAGCNVENIDQAYIDEAGFKAYLAKLSSPSTEEAKLVDAFRETVLMKRWNDLKSDGKGSGPSDVRITLNDFTELLTSYTPLLPNKIPFSTLVNEVKDDKPSDVRAVEKAFDFAAAAAGIYTDLDKPQPQRVLAKALPRYLQNLPVPVAADTTVSYQELFNSLREARLFSCEDYFK